MRTITPAIAAVLEQLELDQPLVVSRKDLDAARSMTGATTTTRYLIEELTARGWLLPLRTRGYWEFAPAARAGAIDAGDPHVELRATLRRRPGLPVALAAESAAWLLGLSPRSPNRHVLAAPAALRIPAALDGYRVIRQEPRLDPEPRNGLPVWGVATLLVAMSHRPGSYRDWPNVSDWLDQAVAVVAEDLLRVELSGESRSTWMRLAYLVDRGGRMDLAERLATNAPPGQGPYYLGPRDRHGRYHRRYEITDSVLEDFAA